GSQTAATSAISSTHLRCETRNSCDYARDLERQHHFRTRQHSDRLVSGDQEGGAEVSTLAQRRSQSGQLQARGRKRWQRGPVGPNRQRLRVREREIRRAKGGGF